MPLLARYGLPNHITTDNGPKFEEVFRSLQRSTSLNTLKLRHDIRCPTARRRTVLKLQNIDASHDPHMSLLNFRNTPEGMDGTLAQRLFSRRTRTSLPMASHLLQPKIISMSSSNWNKGILRSPSTRTEELSSCHHSKSDMWYWQVSGQVEVRSYIVCTEDGRLAPKWFSSLQSSWELLRDARRR